MSEHSCSLCERKPLYRGAWEPMVRYREGDVVDDLEAKVDTATHTEPGGRFVSLACQTSGFLNPRYVVIDMPGRWERVGVDEPGAWGGGDMSDDRITTIREYVFERSPSCRGEYAPAQVDVCEHCEVIASADSIAADLAAAKAHIGRAEKTEVEREQAVRAAHEAMARATEAEQTVRDRDAEIVAWARNVEELQARADTLAESSEFHDKRAGILASAIGMARLALEQGDSIKAKERLDKAADVTGREYGVIRDGAHPDDLHRGPWTKEEAYEWVRECEEDMNFPKGMYVVVSRPVGPWQVDEKEET